MKQFTFKDALPWAGHLGLCAKKDDLVYSPLAWQKLGLQETATGYGAKLTSPYKINFENRLYRLYATCYSNNGSTWFKVRGQKIFVY